MSAAKKKARHNLQDEELLNTLVGEFVQFLQLSDSPSVWSEMDFKSCLKLVVWGDAFVPSEEICSGGEG